MVDNWKYLGVSFNRLANFLPHIKNLKSQVANKQAALLSFYARNHFNSISLHTKLYHSLLYFCMLYAAPMWAWSRLGELEAMQNKYFHRLLLLPYQTPTYLIYAELGLYPIKFKLTKCTFNFWCRLKTLRADSSALFWFNHCLLNPLQKANHLSAFIEIIGPELNPQTSLNCLSEQDIQELQVRVHARELANNWHAIQQKLLTPSFTPIMHNLESN